MTRAKAGASEAESIEAEAKIISSADMWRMKLKPAQSVEPVAVPKPQMAAAGEVPAGWASADVAEDDKPLATEELHRLARQMLICMAGFLAAGWFLSRAFSMWLFAYSGMVCAIFRMAERAGVSVKQDKLGYTLRVSFLTAAGLLIGVYILLKVRSLTGS